LGAKGQQYVSDTDASLEDLRKELATAYSDFYRQASYRSGHWGYWTRSGRRLVGPYNAAQVAHIYRLILAALFILGVLFSVLSKSTSELGIALVVGSLFAFGAWMAQAWALSREEEFRLHETLLGDIRNADLRQQAELIREITRQLQELEANRLGDSEAHK
jgi:hypothetical protein